MNKKDMCLPIAVSAYAKVRDKSDETWTFTLTDNTVVTKTVLCATVTEYAPPVLQEATAPAGFFDDYGSEWDDRKDGESGLLSED